MRKIAFVSGIFLIIFILIVLLGVSSLIFKAHPDILIKTFKSKEFLFSLKFSFATSFIALFLSLIFSIPIAYLLSNGEFPQKRIIESLIDIPIFTPPLVLGLSFLILFGGKFGSLLEQAGITFLFSPPGVIFAQFIIITPYVERYIEVGFSKVNKRYEFIGRSMGLSDFEVFKKITLPLSKDAILAGMITGWGRAISEFGATLMIAGATRMRTETLPVAIFLGISSGDMDFAVSTGTLMLAISFFMRLLMRRMLKTDVGY